MVRFKPVRFRVISSFFALALVFISCLSLFGAESAAVKYATGFSVEYRNGAKYVTVSKPWASAGLNFTYVLYPRGSARPQGPKDARYVPVPVRTAVTFSSSYLAAIDAIGVADSVIGVDSTDYVNTPSLRRRIAAGKVRNAAKNWSPDIETLIALSPDVVFTYGMGNEWDTYPKMEEVGLPVILNGDWNEQDPLGRAEWVKFIALFYDKEAEANAFFARVETRYAAFVALAASAAKKPRILVNAPFQGSWTVSGGRSYMARFIADAGGSYLWSDDETTGGLTLPVETVYARALLADFWLNPGAAANLAAVKASDPRFADLPVLKSGRVFNNDARMNEKGANDYFESGSVSPDVVLGDMISVFHPELLPGWKATYYRRLE